MAEVTDRGQQWELMCPKVRRWFIWLFGVCGWGVSVGVLWSVAFWYFMIPRPTFWLVLPFALVAFSFGGYLWGAAMWWFAERAYRATLRTQEAEPLSWPTDLNKNENPGSG